MPVATGSATPARTIGIVRVSPIRQAERGHLPGDMFGLDPGDEHTFSAEAIAESKVLVIKRRAVTSLAERATAKWLTNFGT
jgi:hypothetical protein